MDYLWFPKEEYADLVDSSGQTIWRFSKKHLDHLLVRGFMSSIKDVRGLWSYLYDITSGKPFRITEADKIHLVNGGRCA